MDRRDFLVAGSLAAAGAAAAPAPVASQDAPLKAPATVDTAEARSRVLTPSEYKAVEAIAGRIIPTTDTPGAIEAGSAEYIDRALAKAYRDNLPQYRKGLGELADYCRSKFSSSFSELKPEQQDAVLKDLEAGNIEQIADGARLFAMLRTHVMEGFFCEPYYGGNRDMIGWKLVGFPGQYFGYDDPYINREIDLPPRTHAGARELP